MSQPFEMPSLQSLTETQTRTESVPVPPELSEMVKDHPEMLGLPVGISKRQGLATLMMRGYQTVAFEAREKQRDEMYDALERDPESRAAVESGISESRRNGFF